MTHTDAARPGQLRAGKSLVATPADSALPVPLLMLVAAFAAGIIAQGGYYLPGRLLLTALVAIAVVLAGSGRILSIGGGRTGSGRGGHWWAVGGGPVLVAGAALGAWALLRAVSAGGAPMAVGAVATLGSVAAALLVLGRAGPVERERCAHWLTGVGAVLAGTAWLGVAWRLPRFADLVDSRLWRGAGTLTYPNAAAALLVPLALLAIAMRAGTGRRWVGGAVSYLLLVGVGAALSRAGLIALVVGLVVLVALTGIRTTLRAAAAPLLGALVAIAALAPSFPASDQPRPWLAVAGLLGGAVLAIGPELLPDRVRGIAVGAAWVLCGVGLWTLRGGPALHQIAASRGNLDSSGRSGAIQAALHLVAQRPLVGTGIGQARFLWATPDGNGQIALYVHNEYLQTLVDLGAIGAALLLLLFIAIAVTIHRGRAFGHRPGIRAGALAALAAFAVHSGVDFLWHIAVLPLAAGLFIGLAATGAGLTAIGGTTTSTFTERNQQ